MAKKEEKEAKMEISFDLVEINEKIFEALEYAEFLVDPLQQALIERYMQQDPAFAQALYIDYTEKFLEFLRHKARHNEPISISIMGIQRGGKSYAAITLHAIMMLLRGFIPDANFIVADKNEYLRALKAPGEQVGKKCFVIDEDKTAVFGTGSIARKQKLLDVQNIIAVNAISTIWIRPDEFSFGDSQYGLRVFGRFEAKFRDRQNWQEECEEMYNIYQKKGGFMDEAEFNQVMKNIPEAGITYKIYKGGKLCFSDFGFVEGERRDKSRMRLTRFMLYNLQESSKIGGLPLGMVYLPPFTEMPELFVDVADFEKQYMDRKMAWVAKEQSSTRDVMYKEKMKIAKRFSKDPKFNQLKSRPDRILYISVELGSEFTKNDCEEIERLAKKIIEGFWTEDDMKRIIGEDDNNND